MAMAAMVAMAVTAKPMQSGSRIRSASDAGKDLPGAETVRTIGYLMVPLKSVKSCG